jgi:outer membrane protein TolC
MRNIILLLIGLFVAEAAFSQQKLSLDSCIAMTKANFPTVKQKLKNAETNELRIKNLKTNYYPKLDLEASASYQSETVQIEINAPIPGLELPEPPLEKYEAALVLKQLIWDGGATKHLKKLEEIQHQLQNTQTDLELYRLEQSVQEIYFGILIMNEVEKQLKASLSLLKSKVKVVNSAVENGVLTPDNRENLQAEIILTEQQIIETEHNKDASRRVLAELTGDSAVLEAGFLPPEISDSILNSKTNQRPEHRLFDLQKEISSRQQDLLNAQRMPKASAFVKGAYGNPGLNMFEDEWGPYYIAGINLQWNVYDWGKIKREKQMAQINQESIEIKREGFNKQIEILLIEQKSDIKKLEELLETDNQLVQIRKSIREKSAARLAGGTITSVDFAETLTKENTAVIQQKIRELKIINAKYNYLRILNSN